MFEPTSSGNPYDPPHEVGESREPHWNYPLGKVYWRLMIATLVVNALLVLVPMYQLPAIKSRPFPANVLQTPTIGVGLFGGMSGDTSPATIFAVLVALAVGGFIILQILPREDLR